MPTTYEDLIPSSVVAQVVEALRVQSATVALGNVIQIPTGEASVPILTEQPTASFVTPRYGGRKPLTQITWSAQRLVAEEIALTLGIPDAYLDDAQVPIWTMIRPSLATAIAQTLDQAGFFGVDAPASYPVGGVAAAAQPPVGTTDKAADSLDAAMAAIEQSGLTPSGIAANAIIRQALRAEARMQLVPVATDIEYAYYGLPTVTLAPWDAAQGDAFVGDYATCLLVGLREDVVFETSTDGVLLDDTGAIAISAFQDDTTLMRVRMRVGVALGVPVGPDGNPTVPFKAAKWTPTAPLTSKSKA